MLNLRRIGCCTALVLAAAAASARADAPAPTPYTYQRSIGNLAPGSGSPEGVSALNGKVLVADNTGNQVYRLHADGSPSDPTLNPVDAYAFSSPRQAVADPGEDGRIAVSDSFHNRAELFTPQGDAIRAFGGNEMNIPRGVAFSKNALIAVAQAGGGAVSVYNSSGDLRGSCTGAGADTLVQPEGVAFDAADNLWVADTHLDRIMEFSLAPGPGNTTTCTLQRTWGQSGAAGGQLSSPTGLTVAPSGRVFVANWGDYRVDEFTPDGGFVGTLGAGADNQVGHPVTVSIDPASSDLFVADTSNNRVERFVSGAASSGGTTTTTTDAAPPPAPPAPPAPAPAPQPQPAPAGLNLTPTRALVALGLTNPIAFTPPVYHLYLDYRPYADGQSSGARLVDPADPNVPPPHPKCVAHCHFWTVQDIQSDIQALHARGIFVDAAIEPHRKSDVDAPYAATAQATKSPAAGHLGPGLVYYSSPLTGRAQLPALQVGSYTAPAQLTVRYWDEGKDPVIHLAKEPCPYEAMPARFTNAPLAQAIKDAEALSKSAGCDLRFRYVSGVGRGGSRVRKVTGKRDKDGEYAELTVLLLTPPPTPPAPSIPPQVSLRPWASDLIAHVAASGVIGGLRSTFPTFNTSWALPVDGAFKVAATDRAMHVASDGTPFSVFLSHAQVSVQFRPEGTRDFVEVERVETRADGWTLPISIRGRDTGGHAGTVQLVITGTPPTGHGATMSVTTSFRVVEPGSCWQDTEGNVFGHDGDGWTYRKDAKACPGSRAAQDNPFVRLGNFLAGLLGFAPRAAQTLSSTAPPATKVAQVSKTWVPTQTTFGGPLSSDPRPGIIAAGSGNVIAAGSGNVIAAGSGNVIASSTTLVAPPDGQNLVTATNVIAAGSGNVIAAGSGNVIAAGAGNVVDITKATVIAAGAGNIIAAGSGNIIAAGSGNIIAAGSGNIMGARPGN